MADNNQYGQFLRLESAKAQKGVMVIPSPQNPQMLTVLSRTGQVIVPETTYETPEH